MISTITNNTDLQLEANGTGKVAFENFAFKNNTITNTADAIAEGSYGANGLANSLGGSGNEDDLNANTSYTSTYLTEALNPGESSSCAPPCELTNTMIATATSPTTCSPANNGIIIISNGGIIASTL